MSNDRFNGDITPSCTCAPDHIADGTPVCACDHPRVEGGNDGMYSGHYCFSCGHQTRASAERLAKLGRQLKSRLAEPVDVATVVKDGEVVDIPFDLHVDMSAVDVQARLQRIAQAANPDATVGVRMLDGHVQHTFADDPLNARPALELLNEAAERAAKDFPRWDPIALSKRLSASARDPKRPAFGWTKGPSPDPLTETWRRDNTLVLSGVIDDGWLITINRCHVVEDAKAGDSLAFRPPSEGQVKIARRAFGFRKATEIVLEIPGRHFFLPFGDDDAADWSPEPT